VILLLVLLALVLRRGLRQETEERPNRVQAALDALIDLLRGQLTSSFSSDRLARDLFPFISTLFLFVLLANWLSVIPYLDSPTKDLNVTMSLALLVLAMSHVLALRAKGVRKYLRTFLEPYPFMLPLNIVGEISKPLSHAFRLFGNVFAGTILVTVVMAKFAPLAVPVALNAFYGLLMGAIQAFVFTMLAVAYINVAVEE
jgi:F-type H+-transporting ATPase subunit a